MQVSFDLVLGYIGRFLKAHMGKILPQGQIQPMDHLNPTRNIFKEK